MSDKIIKGMAKYMEKPFFQISIGSPVNGLTLRVMSTEELYENN